MPTLQHTTQPRRTWSTTTVVFLGLLGTVILMGLVSLLASAPTPSASPASSTSARLPWEEVKRTCTTLADMALDTARFRDQGLTRAMAEATLHQPGETAFMRGALSLLLSEVYEWHRYDAPAQVAKATESECRIQLH